MRDSSVAACAMAAKSCASCTEFEHSIAKPVCRQAITSEWSPKIDSACVASVRAATCMHERRQLARDLVHVGDHQQQALRRREGGRERARLQRAVDRAGRARLRLHLDHLGDAPQRFGLPRLDHSSQTSAIGLLGVIG